MPGKGRSVERAYTAEESEALGEGRALLGETTRDVYLNPEACWRNVPAHVWDYILGGYQVMKKWLSYREHALLGRDLFPDEARDLLEPSLSGSPSGRWASCSAGRRPATGSRRWKHRRGH